jgi:type III pantothenate kinase
MLLALDVGNTETAVGLYDGKELRHHWRLTTTPGRTGDEIGVMLHSLLASAAVPPGAVDGMAVSTVVPELVSTYRLVGRRLVGRDPLIIDHETIPGLRILILDPATAGPDRLVNTVAVVEGYGAPALVVDLGTATTVDVVGPGGEYVGGLIAPGITTAADALFRAGARLARVEIKPPARVVGRSTEECMQSGIFYGAVGAVDAMVRLVIREEGFPPDLPVVATGGLAGSVGDASETITAVDPALTLTGIRLVWERVAASGSR